MTTMTVMIMSFSELNTVRQKYVVLERDFIKAQKVIRCLILCDLTENLFWLVLMSFFLSEGCE